MFGSAPFGSTASTIGGKAPLALNLGTLQNPMKDVEVTSPPDDSVSAMKFSPKANFLVASSWSNDVCYIYICQYFLYNFVQIWISADIVYKQNIVFVNMVSLLVTCVIIMNAYQDLV